MINLKSFPVFSLLNLKGLIHFKQGKKTLFLSYIFICHYHKTLNYSIDSCLLTEAFFNSASVKERHCLEGFMLITMSSISFIGVLPMISSAFPSFPFNYKKNILETQRSQKLSLFVFCLSYNPCLPKCSFMQMLYYVSHILPPVYTDSVPRQWECPHWQLTWKCSLGHIICPHGVSLHPHTEIHLVLRIPRPFPQ